MSEGDALRRAAVLIDTSRFADAIRELGAYLATNPGDGQALCLLARAHLGAGDPAAALDASNAAAHALPESDWPPRLASIAMMRQKRWSAAAWAAERAIQFSPNGWRSYLQRAQVDVASRHVTAAGRRAADKAVELAPQEAEVHVAMGNIELIQRRVGPARKSYLEALRIDPNNASARNNLSVVHLRQRRLLRSLT
jgi:tetratricopeptide (TPR) repeat protein